MSAFATNQASTGTGSNTGLAGTIDGPQGEAWAPVPEQVIRDALRIWILVYKFVLSAGAPSYILWFIAPEVVRQSERESVGPRYYS